MRRNITRTIRGFAIAIAIVLAFGGVFSLYTGTLSDEQQEEVLIKAIPFVAVFVSILLTFIGLIAVMAVILNRRIPPRTYQPIEYLIIAGILLGVVGLFQGWKLFVYQNGFMLLLISVLSFILWSHIIPMPFGEAKKLPGFSQQARTVGIIAGVIVWAALSVYISIRIEPQEPYGEAQRIWDMMMEEEQREQIREDFADEYIFNRIPAAVLISLMPAGIAFFAAREIAETTRRRAAVSPPPAPPKQEELPVTIG